ncbi:phage tail tape measure protein [Flavobacterium anhuiense]|uniref:phage tail tape measure protein n=1 Tax=Flavobacterium anhuiense TaxID=459526 RepID=UPI000E6D03F4|nr:phage tail tape measure protein [Flavobacterium anhuiense]
MFGGLASINVKFQVDLTQFSTGMQNALRDIDKFGQKMQKMGRTMTTYVTLPLLAAAGASVKFATDYEESLNKVDVAFDTSSKVVRDFGKTTLETYGIAEGTALDMAAAYGDMGTSMGLTTAQAAKMSTTLVGLAGDISSFKNIGIDQANTALASIFTGETESLKKLGIVMTEQNLQEFALSKGIKTRIKDMDQASKVNLRYAYVMEATSNAQGDFARTGGGAANQSRIFKESLKELGQQFGQVILPYFTKAITTINATIKGLLGMSEGARGTIIVVAGLAAAIGPLLIAIGAVASTIPLLVSGFMTLRTAVMATYAVIAANPMAILVLVAQAAALAMLVYSVNTKRAATAQDDLNAAIRKGNENATQEVATLDKIYASATNVKLGTVERKKAVDDLQALYPAYFKNLKDEIILNGQAKTTYDELREAIFNKSRATAIDNELQKRANDRVEQEIKLRNNIAATEAEISRLRKGANVVVIQEANAAEKTARITMTKSELIARQTELLRIQNAELKKFNADNLKADEVLFTAKEEYLRKSGKLEENEKLKLQDIKIGTDAIKESIDALKPGTIAYYESLIKLQRQEQENNVTSNAEWLKKQAIIDDYQKKIDEITKKQQIKLPRPELPDASSFDGIVPLFSLEDLKDQLSYFEKLREQFSTTAEEYQNLTNQINNTKIKIDAIEGAEDLDTKITKLTDAQKRMAEIATLTGQSVSDAFAGMANNLVESLGLAQSGFGGFVGGMIQTVTKLIAMMLASAISQSIAGATASGTATGPFAVVTTPAFIATAVGGVLAAFAAIPKFATGGIVGGSSYYGDKIMTRLNSGELVANQDQQRTLWGMISNTGKMVNVVLGGGFVVEGDKLRLVLDRTDSRNSRIG